MMSELSKKMEPGVSALRVEVDEAAQISIAISLKRIADAVAGSEHNTGMHRLMMEFMRGHGR